MLLRGICRALPVAAVATLLATTAAASPVTAHQRRDPVRWTGGWGSALIAPFPDFFGEPNWSGGFDNHSVRQVVRVSRGGSSVRIRVSNVYGDGPLRLTAATIGRAAQGAAVRAGTVRPVTFRGQRSTVVPAGQEAASDAVRLRVSPLERLTVTLYFDGPTGPVTFHPLAVATVYRASGDHRFDTDAAAYGETSTSLYYLSGVDVSGTTRGGQGTVVAFGDSITDGAITTVDADNRYPDELAERLVAAGRPTGVVNAGIGGNKVLSGGPGFGVAAVERFRRDALGQPGVRTVIVLEGINDIGGGEAVGTPVTAEQLIAGHQALIRAAHWRGVRIIGATITPSKGCPYPGYDTARGEAVRDAVNHWIRTSGEYDAVFDFDRALADPADPDRMRAEYDAGDALHPNDAGMRALAEAVDLDQL
ncbi:SGNH/GDSL hydrolase family protein [Phytohabitans sp. ZYX-F-186]|uniref:SGNH/GDSL hydrolase family protein n=1 Tax=Phytohabitans maris TaxID=3071409 RepID=A0ABU0ZJ18_9ACTN|nr:SGNH/GDSL hydrolase family protein [Phytohabitans sp. ZYX-F-186]MDQ7906399.1 SGNH/GDSL hydrolase family protein [Phytohabitans sp. ZYX-F-186]